jgi:hypothetical protein
VGEGGEKRVKALDFACGLSISLDNDMVISASRRTDIPSHYSAWFFNRVKEKVVYVRNPMNIRQVSRINFSPDVVDCIVFWSKNPSPMLDKLHVIKDYAYYFQFTLNPYQQDIETNLPPKNKIVETFKKLSDSIGREKIIWRYDPVLLNNKYNVAYHIDNFGTLAAVLKGYTGKVTFSFIDFYKKIADNIKIINASEITAQEKNILADNFSKIAKENNFQIESCAEDIELTKYGISHARCIDDRLIAKILGCNFAARKDNNQRLECGCVKSIDIGEYNSCLNGCIYCYANHSRNTVLKNREKHDAASPVLIGNIQPNDIISERKIVSNKNIQEELF